MVQAILIRRTPEDLPIGCFDESRVALKDWTEATLDAFEKMAHDGIYDNSQAQTGPGVVDQGGPVPRSRLRRRSPSRAESRGESLRLHLRIAWLQLASLQANRILLLLVDVGGRVGALRCFPRRRRPRHALYVVRSTSARVSLNSACNRPAACASFSDVISPRACRSRAADAFRSRSDAELWSRREPGADPPFC